MTTDDHQGSENPLKEASIGREVRVDPETMAALQRTLRDNAVWRDLAAKCLQEVRDKRALEGSAQTEAAALRSEDMMALGNALLLRDWWLDFHKRFLDANPLRKATNTHDTKLALGALDGPALEVAKLFCEALLHAKKEPDKACSLLARVIELGDTCDAPERWFARIVVASMLKQQGRAEEAARAYDELAYSARKAGLCKLAVMGLAGVNRCARAGEAPCSAVQPSCPSGDKDAWNRWHASTSCRSKRSSRSRPERRTR